MPIRRHSHVFLAVLMLLTTACGGGDATSTEPPGVASIIVTPSTASVQVQSTISLTAAVRNAAGAELTGRTVSWSSSDATIASVSNGNVTGVAPGTTNIVVTSEGRSATAQITVVPIPVATVGISPASASITVLTNTTLVATTRDANGAALTGRSIAWTSADATIATVSNGLVTGIAAGSTTITATSEGRSASAQITVTPVPVASVTIAPLAASTTVRGTTILTAVARDAAGTTLLGRQLAWTSNAPAVATVSGGEVTGVSPGVATITVSSEGRTASAQVTVTPIPVASVTVSPSTATLSVLGTTTLTAVVRDASGAVLDGRVITWTSSDVAIATVVNGVVTGVAPGAATVTATSEGRSANAAVTVSFPAMNQPTVAVASGTSCALSTSGRAYCWGNGANGRRGDGTTTSTQTDARPVAGGHVFVAIASANLTFCALRADGTVWCWGGGSEGTLGNGTTTATQAVPVQVSGTNTFVRLSGSGFGGTMCALDSAARSWCWGRNGGQLGAGSTAGSLVPVAASGTQTFRQVSTGSSVTCWLGVDNLAYCAGSNGSSELGAGFNGGAGALSPSAVSGNLAFTRVFAGANNACGTRSDGSAWCWGRNGEGQLGDNSTVLRDAPVRVSGSVVFERVVPGSSHTCGLSTTGAAWCWGSGSFIGTGTAVGSLVPVAVAGNHVFSEIALSFAHTCGRAADGIRCWGGNSSGETGDGTLTLRLTPGPVVVLPP